MIEKRFCKLNPEQCEPEDRNSGNDFIVGLASVYYNPSDNGTEFVLWDRQGSRAVERIHSGAFTRALKENQDVRCLFNHDSNILLGRTKSGTLTLTESKFGLRYKVPYDAADSDHVRVMRKIQKGDIDGSSFAFIPKAENWTEENGTYVRNITDVDLMDVSPVTSPAYKSAQSKPETNRRKNHSKHTLKK